MSHSLSGWTFRFCSVAKALALFPAELQFYLWAEFPQTRQFGSESHTPTRQPTTECADAGNKHTHQMSSNYRLANGERTQGFPATVEGKLPLLNKHSVKTFKLYVLLSL
jgi:hypothetical protein